MNLQNTLYNARNGRAFTWDISGKALVETGLQYVNPSPYGVAAFVPDEDFQQIFADAFFSAWEGLKGKLTHDFVFDKKRLGSLPDGQGIFNGDLTFFLVRSDYSEGNYSPDYSVEERATLAVTYFAQGGPSGIIQRIQSDILTIDAKD